MVGPSGSLNVVLAGGWNDFTAKIGDYKNGEGVVTPSKVVIDNIMEEEQWTGNHAYTGGTEIYVGGEDGVRTGNHLQLNIRGSLNCFGTGPVTLHGTSNPYSLRLSMAGGGFTNQLNVNGAAWLMDGDWNGPVNLVAPDSVLALAAGHLTNKVQGPGSIEVWSDYDVGRLSATASTFGDSGSVRSVITVTYSLCRFFRLISSMPTCLMTRAGAIRLSSFNWFSTISSTVSAEMPSRAATSSSLLPMSIRSTYSSKR